MLLPVHGLFATASGLHKDVFPQPLKRFRGHAADLGGVTLNGAVLCAQHGQGSAHSFFPRTDHPLGLVPLTLEGPSLDESLDKLLLALAQPDLGQIVLVGDDLILNARQAEQQGAYDARPVLARAAVDQNGRRLFLAGEVGEDGAEGRIRVVRMRTDL